MNFYNHGTSVFDEMAWTIWQYHDSETQSGIVMAFRRCESPFEQVKIDLNGLLADRSYQVVNLDDNTARCIKNSIDIILPKKRSSTILEYKIQ